MRIRAYRAYSEEGYRTLYLQWVVLAAACTAFFSIATVLPMKPAPGTNLSVNFIVHLTVSTVFVLFLLFMPSLDTYEKMLFAKQANATSDRIWNQVVRAVIKRNSNGQGN